MKKLIPILAMSFLSATFVGTAYAAAKMSMSFIKSTPNGEFSGR
jgi:hypothetical protein